MEEFFKNYEQRSIVFETEEVWELKMRIEDALKLGVGCQVSTTYNFGIGKYVTCVTYFVKR